MAKAAKRAAKKVAKKAAAGVRPKPKGIVKFKGQDAIALATIRGALKLFEEQLNYLKSRNPGVKKLEILVTRTGGFRKLVEDGCELPSQTHM